jgi:Zincin-like metallopeptidase
VSRPPRGPVRRRDRHGRGLRGSLVPPGVPLHRTRSERFDDLVLLAVSQLEPRWEAELSAIEFGVEEIPPILPDTGDPDPVPLARLEPGSARLGPGEADGARLGPGEAGGARSGRSEPVASGPLPAPRDAGGLPRDAPEQPARIVLYRRPLLARADGEEELAELVLDVIVEQFAHWLGVDPQTVDPGYPAEE